MDNVWVERIRVDRVYVFVIVDDFLRLFLYYKVEFVIRFFGDFWLFVWFGCNIFYYFY